MRNFVKIGQTVAQRDPINKKGPPHDQKHVDTKHDDFPITFSIRFYNSCLLYTSDAADE